MEELELKMGTVHAHSLLFTFQGTGGNGVDSRYCKVVVLKASCHHHVILQIVCSKSPTSGWRVTTCKVRVLRMKKRAVPRLGTCFVYENITQTNDITILTTTWKRSRQIVRNVCNNSRILMRSCKSCRHNTQHVHNNKLRVWYWMCF